MVIFSLVASFVFLTIFTYCVLNLKKKKYAYHVSIGIINIYCLAVFIYFLSAFDIKNYLALFNFIISILFHFDSKFDLTKRKAIRLVAIGIVWFFTGISVLLCFSGFGALLLSITQPISYVFVIKLLKNKADEIELALYINLLINWGLLCYTTVWTISH